MLLATPRNTQVPLKEVFPIRRSYLRDVLVPLEGARGVVDHLARVAYGEYDYDLFALRCGTGATPRASVLISAGIHGDEPAGVYALVDFIRNDLVAYLDDLRFYILPCVNPSGFEADTLETMSGANLNRLFGTSSPQPEIRAIEEWLGSEVPDLRLTLDLHETTPDYRGEGFVESDNPRGCYLFEDQHERRKRIGRTLIDALPATMVVCDWPQIYGDDNDGGVISYPEACHNPVYAQRTTFESFLHDHYSRHAITTETPVGWRLERRIEAQRIWIRAALEILVRTPEG